MTINFAVEILPPDLNLWRDGNTGVEGFTSFASGLPGPHVVVLSLMHGNEYAGAAVLDRLLRAKFRPLRGKLTLGFANLAAFDKFDPANPTASRYLEHDMNRVWSDELLREPGRSLEHHRAREMRPLLESADLLLDLHSMLWPGEPLILAGPSASGLALGIAMGVPGLVVADRGHLNGPRLIDSLAFTGTSGRTAVLVEGGSHWQESTVECLMESVAALLRLSGLAAPDDPRLPPPVDAKVRTAQVTHTITASSHDFRFMEAYPGGTVIPWRDTLIARDGERAIRTPYDNCLLVMPSWHPARGHTAVRLAEFV